MKRINSRTTFYYKKIQPLILLAMLCFFLRPIFNLILKVFKEGDSALNFQVSPLYLTFPALFLFLLSSYYVIFSTKADLVFDDGQSLIITKSGQEITLPISQIKTISYGYTWLFKIQTVTIMTKQDTALGNTIKFMPPFTWLPFSKHRDIKDLMLRVRNA